MKNNVNTKKKRIVSLILIAVSLCVFLALIWSYGKPDNDISQKTYSNYNIKAENYTEENYNEEKYPTDNLNSCGMASFNDYAYMSSEAERFDIDTLIEIPFTVVSSAEILNYTYTLAGIEVLDSCQTERSLEFTLQFVDNKEEYRMF